MKIIDRFEIAQSQALAYVRRVVGGEEIIDDKEKCLVFQDALPHAIYVPLHEEDVEAFWLLVEDLAALAGSDVDDVLFRIRCEKSFAA